MRKIYLALMCMASLAIVTACGGGNQSSNAESTTDDAPQEQTAEQTDGGQSKALFAANLPANLKLSIKSTEYGEVSEGFFIKLGNSWLNVLRPGTDDQLAVFCQFDEQGKSKKAVRSLDGGKTWDNVLEEDEGAGGRYTDFRDFIKRSLGSDMLALCLPMISGQSPLDFYEAADETANICGRECKLYNEPQFKQASAYVDAQSKFPFKYIAYSDQAHQKPVLTIEVTGWDESISGFGMNVPQ